MNSERRHELQQNELAIYISRINRTIEPYSRLIALAVGVCFIGAIGFLFYDSQQSGQRSDATLNLIQASASQDAEELLVVSENYPDTAAGDWARLYQGQQYLAQGIQALYTSRTNAEELLGDAQQVFKRAAAGSTDRVLRSRAHYGIARAAESLGNLDEAIEAYGEVIAINESEAMVDNAQERVDALANPKTKEFLAWFGDQNFVPADPSLPPRLPGSDSLPEFPDLKLSTLGVDGDDEMELKDGGIEMPDKSAKDGAKEEGSKEEGSTEEGSTEAGDSGAAPKKGDDTKSAPAADSAEKSSEANSDSAEAESEGDDGSDQ